MKYAEITSGIEIYNFPWLAVYYLEWYKLNGEKNALKMQQKKYYRFLNCERRGAVY